MRNLNKLFVLNKFKSSQFPVLVRHFFQRLFLNDFVAFEDQMKEKTISFLALIAILSAHISNAVLMKYMFVPDDGVSWVEKCYFTSFIMLLIGFITVFEWDVIFPDSRDFANLMTLPIKLRTIFMTKFTSLCLFVGIFALGANSFSTFGFWSYLIDWQEKSGLLFSLFYILAHFVCMFAAIYFVFFFSVFVIGVLMLVFPERIFRALSVFFRTVFMTVFVFLMIYIVSNSFTASQPFAFLPDLKENHSILLYVFPPMWFTGLFESMIGSHDSQFSTLSSIAILSLVLVTIGFFLSAVASYRKYCRHMEIKKNVNIRLIRIKYFLQHYFDVVFLRNSVQRAVFYFFGKTIRNSMVHKMRLATFAAVGAGLGLILIATNIRSFDNFYELNTTLLSIPTVLTFFLLVGIRNVVNIPSSLEANWVFRLTEENDLNNYSVGLRKGIVFNILFPLFVLVFLFYSFSWGWRIGILHSLYGLVVAVLLMEVLFLKYHKIPFACSYLPGKAKAHYLWLLYLVSFISYIFLISSLELALLKSPYSFVFFLGISLFLFLALRVYQKQVLYKKMVLIYADEPEPVMVTLFTYGRSAE